MNIYAGTSQYHYARYDECQRKNVPPAFPERHWSARQRSVPPSASSSSPRSFPHLHVDNLVVDLWIDPWGKLTLIEINAYGLC